MIRRLVWTILVLTCWLAFACNQPPAPVPPAADLTPRPAAEQFKYIEQKITMAPRTGPGDAALLDKNQRSYFGCLEKNKDDDCRFMLCSPYAVYAGDEHFLMGQFDDAFTMYAAAHNLVQQEVAGTVQKRNQREAEFEEKTKSGQATDDDRRLYFYRRAILSHNLYRNYAEMARLLERFAVVFEKQQKPDEAANARATRDAFLQSAADEYRDYFMARQSLLPLLDPKNAEKGANFRAVIDEMDGLLELRHF